MLHLRLNWPNAYGELYLEIGLLQALKESRLDIVEELLERAIEASLRGGTLSHAVELGFQEMVTSRLRQGAG